MAWVLSIPKARTKKALLDWAHEQVKRDVPRQVICDYLSFDLLARSPLSTSFCELEAVSEAESELTSVILERNLNGISLEKAGELDEAIELYEANVTDWFSGNHPYDRLRTIYTKRKQCADAIRV